MKFTIPQNIDVAEKVLGSLTFPQVIYLVGAGGFSFFLFMQSYSLFITFPLLFIVDLLALLLAFYRPFNMHFIVMLRAFSMYIWNKKIFIWKKNNVKSEIINIKKI